MQNRFWATAQLYCEIVLQALQLYCKREGWKNCSEKKKKFVLQYTGLYYREEGSGIVLQDGCIGLELYCNTVYCIAGGWAAGSLYRNTKNLYCEVQWQETCSRVVIQQAGRWCAQAWALGRASVGAGARRSERWGAQGVKAAGGRWVLGGLAAGRRLALQASGSRRRCAEGAGRAAAGAAGARGARQQARQGRARRAAWALGARPVRTWACQPG